MFTDLGVLTAEIKSAQYVETKEVLGTHTSLPRDEHNVELHMGNLVLLTGMLHDIADSNELLLAVRHDIQHQLELCGATADQAAELAHEHLSDAGLSRYSALSHLRPDDTIAGLERGTGGMKIDINHPGFVRGILASARANAS